MNPTGSLKDRSALCMIEEAEKGYKYILFVKII